MLLLLLLRDAHDKMVLDEYVACVLCGENIFFWMASVDSFGVLL